MKDWNLFEKVWMVVFTVLIVGLSFYWKDSFIGITCSLTGIWCVILVAKGKISNYIVGTINIILYAYISYKQMYYGEVMLNVIYFLPMQFIGVYMWMKNKKTDSTGTVNVKMLSNNRRLIYVIISLASVFLYGIYLKSLGGKLPYIDSMSTVLSIMAMLLMAWRYVEQWVLWIVVDIVTIVLWLVVMVKGGNDISVLLMWVAYLINAIYGLYNWIKIYRLQEVK